MKIFFVHAIGHTDLDQNYYQPWETDVTNQLKSSGVQTDPRTKDSRAIRFSNSTITTPLPMPEH
jgi:hypothetical protein